MRILAIIGALAILAAIAAAVFFFGGYYDVAAKEPDSGVVGWALVHVRAASIDHHANDTPPTSLNDAVTIRAGARAFATAGCINCHGAPGVTWAKFSEGLNPSPPDLKDVSNSNPAQLFWVVRNGIRMTGMPSFSAAGLSDDAIWSIVAFVRKLPTVTEDDFKAWSAGP